MNEFQAENLAKYQVRFGNFLEVGYIVDKLIEYLTNENSFWKFLLFFFV